MKERLTDTDPQAECVQIAMLSAAPEWKRAELMFDMIEALRGLVFAGVRERYPLADESEVRRRAADILPGEELAALAYGPLRQRAEPPE